MSSLDSTFGAAFIGVVIAAILHGVTCLQSWYYFFHQKDTWRLKSLVTAVMLFDTVHQALISHTVYTYVITNWGKPDILGMTVWSLLLEVLFNGFTALLVQGFLTVRVWLLSNRTIWLTAVVASLVIAEFVCVIVFGVYALVHVQTFEDLGKLKNLSIAVNALAAAGDITISLALVFLLSNTKANFTKSKRMIRTLIIYTVNTGAFTALCAIASLVSILVWDQTFIYITFFFCIGRLYSNSLLATLNARGRIRESAEGVNTTSDNYHMYSSKDAQSKVLSTKLSGLSSNGRHATNISIKIDTTKEFATDDGVVTGTQTLHGAEDDQDSSSSKDSLTFNEMIHVSRKSVEIV